MKKSIFILAAICAASLVSCTQKELAVDTPTEQSGAKLIPITITANLEGTKADMAGESGAAWTWKSGDKLAVYDGTSKQEFTLDESSAGTSVAKFTGSVTEGFTSLQAVFPYAKAGDSFETPLIPAEQSIADGTVDANAMIAVASEGEKVSDSEYNFYFTSGVSFLRFTPPAGATKVILHTAAKGETLAGDSPSVTVDLGTAADGTRRFWAAVNPAKLSGIHVFTLKSDGKYYRLGTANEIDLSTPGKGRNLGSLAAGTEVAVIEDGSQLASPAGLAGLDVYVVNDLDLTGVTLSPIASFSNTLDGLWHSISNWTASNALFSSVSGIIRNLTIASSCMITSASDDNIAFITNSLTGTVDNCHNYGNISLSLAEGTAERFIGSLVSNMSESGAKLSNCSNDGDIEITTTLTSTIGGYQHIGGLVGQVGGVCDEGVVRLQGCSNTGNVSVSVSGPSGTIKHHYVGGIVGSTAVNAGTETQTSGFTNYYGEFRECSNEGNVTATWTGGTGGYFKLGGILGYCEGAIFDSSNKGGISYKNTGAQNAAPAVGGIAGVVAGESSVSAKDCINEGPIDLSGVFTNAVTAYTYSTAGVMWASAGGCFGAVGDNTTLVENCDNKGKVTVDGKMPPTAASSSSFGGVIGVSMAEVKYCDNLATEQTSLSGMSKNCHLGGCLGCAYKPVSNCKVSAPLKMAFDVTTLTTNQASAISNIGGIVGYTYSGASVSDCEVNSESLTATSNGELRFGGIVGMSYVKVSGCTNNAVMDVKRSPIIEGLKYVSYCGGVVGYQFENFAVEGSANKSKLSVTLDADSQYSYVAGVVAYTKGNSIAGCSNSGDIEFDGGGMAKQMCVCGICGWNNVTATFEDLVNSGNITVSNWENSAFNYVAGIVGNYYTVPSGGTGTSATNNTYIRCSNSGTITSNTKCKMRIGGIGAAINATGTVSDCHNTGDIIMTNGLASSQIGGIAGYCGKGNISNCSSTGSVSGDAANVSLVGGLVGALNVNSTWTGIESSGSAIASTGNYAGSLLGGFSATGKTLTLSGTNVITATVNGSPASEENAVGYLNSSSLVGY